MILREFFTGRGIVFGVLIVIGLGVFAYQAYFSPTETPEASQLLDFTWKFEEAETLNLDGFPETDIFLEAKYSDGKVERKLIDTVAGGCNELPDSEEVQCYYAGLGYRYRITKGENSYLVEKKTFEEALPDYDASLYEYEVVAEFPVFYK